MFSPSQFNALLTDLVNDSDNTMDVLYNAMGAVVDIEKKVKEVVFYYWPILPTEHCLRWKVSQAAM